MKFSIRGLGSGLLVTIVAGLSACGGDDDDSLSDIAQAKCASLAGAQVAAADIGLPTSGAVVTSATLTPASDAGAGAGVGASGEYCKVLASIKPVDPDAPEIRLQLNLPTSWNGRAYMQGGGGYNGSIPNTTAQYASGAVDQRPALHRGYATFSSDSGHQGRATYTSQDGSFGLNDEALNNFAADALKKTRDAAMNLIRLRYERAPRYSYFVGGSTGGREALAFAQRWPNDFDGVVSIFPAWNAATLDLFFGAVTERLAAPGGYLNVDKQKLVYDAVMARCDDLDGVADGLIGNLQACENTFDVDTLLCAGGLDLGNHCLSTAQRDTVRTYATPLTFNYPLASGETGYPAFPVLSGANMGGPLALNTAAPTHPSDPRTQPYFTVFWDQFVRYFITGDENFDYLTFSATSPPVAYLTRISELTRIMDINQADLSAFKASGGKLILIHGLADSLVSHRSTVNYYERMVQTMTQAGVNEFTRFYTVPGYGHVLGAFAMSWDSLDAIRQWVEAGIAPSDPIVMDANAGTRGRTRPLCEWPAFPRYVGGNMNLASSFVCATQ